MVRDITDEKVQQELVTSLSHSLEHYDLGQVQAHCTDIVDSCNSHPGVFQEKYARQALGALRKKRCFELLQSVADTFLQTGRHSDRVWRLYAQALLDQGNITAGILVLERLEGNPDTERTEREEAVGLLGRAYKQLYLRGDSRERITQERLLKAIDYYHRAYQANESGCRWQGINAAALLARAKRDRLEVAGAPDPRALAGEILSAIQDRFQEGTADLWDHGTAAEACLGLGDNAGAEEWLERYVSVPGTDAFELSTTHRQLVEVWGLTITTEPGKRLLPILCARLLKTKGSYLDFDREQVEFHLEKVFGAAMPQSLQWYQDGLKRAQAVACIRRGTDGFGTGFLVPLEGREFGSYLLTNSHVLSPGSTVRDSLDVSEAVVAFEARENEIRSVAEVLWWSPPDVLDACLVRLDRKVEGVTEYPVAPHLPVVQPGDDEPRVYVIGHPKGGGLKFSLQDNELMALDDTRLHYRAPTEGGSSGSPVFNQQWKLIGLHHAGAERTRRLDGRGFYAANEGIVIHKVLAEALAGSVAQ